jgi:hypothetical protein
MVRRGNPQICLADCNLYKVENGPKSTRKSMADFRDRRCASINATLWALLEPVHGERADDQPRNRRDANAEGGTDQPCNHRDDEWKFLPGRTACFEKSRIGLVRSQVTTLFDEVLEQVDWPYSRVPKQRTSHIGTFIGLASRNVYRVSVAIELPE